MSDPAALLREHGLSVTAQRLAVLRAVSSRPHSTADALAEDVRAEIGVISRQAVYNALATLAEKGLIRRIQPAGSAALYEDRVGDNHHHLICHACGITVDVDCAVGKAPCLTASSTAGFRIHEAEVIYWGTCPECLDKEAAEDGQSSNTTQKPQNETSKSDQQTHNQTHENTENRCSDHTEAPRELGCPKSHDTTNQ